MKKLLNLLVFFLCANFVFAQNIGTELNTLSQIKSGVKSKRISSYDRSGGNADRVEDIQPGEKRIVVDIPGAGIINHIWVTIAPDPKELSRNDIILRMYWDGNEFPSVESPIGPFFGQGWNENYSFSSLPLASGPADGLAMVSYFSMPFAKGARIEIENQGDRKIESFYFYVDYFEMGKLPETYGRFHAWYNHALTEADPKGENEWGMLGKYESNKDGSKNYLIADIKGKGQFVGVNYYVHSPGPMWYGEGDDMIFIDGDEMPTLHGTGTEDYFNTAWCPKTLFQHPYYGYARVNDNIGWLGRTHVYRFNIADPICFDKSLKFTIEHGHANNLTLDLGSVAYWYLQNAAALPNAPTKEERKVRPFIDLSEIHLWRNQWRKSKGNLPSLWGNE